MKAELDKLALVLAPEELDAVHVIIDAMVRMAGAPLAISTLASWPSGSMAHESKRRDDRDTIGRSRAPSFFRTKTTAPFLSQTHRKAA